MHGSMNIKTINHQEAVTVYAAYGICHASTLISRSTLIVLAASQRTCMINTICCIYSNCLLMMNSNSTQNM